MPPRLQFEEGGEARPFSASEIAALEVTGGRRSPKDRSTNTEREFHELNGNSF